MKRTLVELVKVGDQSVSNPHEGNRQRGLVKTNGVGFDWLEAGSTRVILEPLIACPKCGEALRRIHRRPLDRALSAVSRLSLRRYECVDPECGWQGLRRKAHFEHTTVNEHLVFE